MEAFYPLYPTWEFLAKSHQLIKEFCILHEIHLHFTTPYHSNSNSPVERFHSTIIDSIRCLKQEYQKPIRYLMILAVLLYNNSIHSVTKMTPYEIEHGPQTSPFDISQETLVNQYTSLHKKNLQVLHTKIKDRIQTTKENVITKNSSKSNDPEPLETDQAIFVRTKARKPKNFPRFKETNVIQDKDNTVLTDIGLVHKNKIRKTRKITPILQSNNTDNNDPHLNTEFDSYHRYNARKRKPPE